MVDMHCCPTKRWAVFRPQVAGTGLVLVMALLVGGTLLPAQQPPIHYEHDGMLPPGAIGSRQLARGAPLPGSFQQIEIVPPAGASVSLAVEAQFTPPAAAPLKAGMLIG